MLRKTPPLEAIEVFVAATRASSFRAVARDLALSPSAVSRRIATLESFLGATLFERDAAGPTLTAAGRRYLGLVEPAVKDICSATSALMGAPAGAIQIAASTSLAGAWLIPRLRSLEDLLGVEIEVVLSRDFDALRSGAAQYAVWGGLDTPDDMISESICSTLIAPVRAVCAGGGAAVSLRDQALLTTPDSRDDWARWFAADARKDLPDRLRLFPNHSLAYEAAVAGLGIALGMPLLAEPYIQANKLEACGPARSGSGGYSLYRLRRAGPRGPRDRKLLHWLRNEAARSEQLFTVAA